LGKPDEKAYYSRLGVDGQRHAEGKPFTDAACSELLMSLGQLIALLPPPPARLLDLGCGTGWTSEFFAKAGYAVVGIDLSIDMIRAARRIRSRSNLDFMVGDCESIPAAAAFDVITCYSSLHHVDSISSALASCRKALKPNGVLILMEPGEGHAESENSQNEKAKYGITEQSLPPNLLCPILKSVGFHDIEVIPWLAFFLGPISMPIESKNWKYRFAASLIGRKMADFLELYRSRSRGVAVVRARA
jgi:SAM-dependent methyltransferase